MAKMILTKRELNTTKLAIAVLHRNPSWLLQREKLYDIVDCLRYETDEVIDDWVEETQQILIQGRMSDFKKKLLKELIHLEAYLEIVELNLNYKNEGLE